MSFDRLLGLSSYFVSLRIFVECYSQLFYLHSYRCEKNSITNHLVILRIGIRNCEGHRTISIPFLDVHFYNGSCPMIGIFLYFALFLLDGRPIYSNQINFIC